MGKTNEPGASKGGAASAEAPAAAAAASSFPVKVSITNNAPIPLSFPEVGALVPVGETVTVDVSTPDQLERLKTDVSMLSFHHGWAKDAVTLSE